METTLFVLIFSSSATASSVFPPVHYQEWFPGPGWKRGGEVRPGGRCAQEYQIYLANTEPCGYTGPDCLIVGIVNCLLSIVTPSTVANQQAAAILLGLLPTILAMAGSTTVEIGLLAYRRPLLAFLVAMETPIVNPIRAFDYRYIV
jgi:hypothetical protein